ncbi:MAG: SAM hydrolase/SAM-dependent halogenase family protein [Thermoanaerobaculia bacterium]
MTRTRIALLTDFGTRDPYVASMKGVIAARTEAPIFDLTHEIAPHDVREGAWFLRTVETCWAAGTIFVAVIDPGVGTERRILAASRDERIYLAPDNGLLTFVADRAEIRSVEDASLFLPGGSSTFHGRDRFAPVAAALANGLSIDKLGPSVHDIIRLDYERGTIVSIDRFGNAITDLTPPTARFAVKVNGVAIDRLVRTYEEGGERPFLIIGSAGCIEISLRNGSAADLLHLRRGDRVEILQL